MPTLQVNDAELYYEIHGSGFPIVLSHTGRTSLNNFDQNIPVLAEKYQVIAYDRRGCGRSTAPEGTDSAETWVRDLYGLLQRLEISRAYFGGVSYGAMLSVEFLFAHPEMVEALISSCGNPFGWGHDRPNPIPFPDRRAQLPTVQTLASRKLTPATHLNFQLPLLRLILRLHLPFLPTPSQIQQSRLLARAYRLFL